MPDSRPSLTKIQREVDRLEGSQNAHERECALRYGELNTSIADLKDGMKWVIRLAVGIMLSLIAWLAIQLWNTKAPPIPAPAYVEREQ